VIRWIFLIVGWWIVFPAITNISGAWQSQAYPVSDVHVVFKDGSEATGHLSRQFDNRWLLVSQRSAVRQFDEGEYLSMDIPVRHSAQPASIWLQWRAWLPPAATGYVFLMAILWPFMQARVHRRTIST